MRSLQHIAESAVRKIPVVCGARQRASLPPPSVVDAAQKLQVNAAQTVGGNLQEKCKSRGGNPSKGGVQIQARVCNQRDGGPSLGAHTLNNGLNLLGWKS